jgi:MFS family permease
MGPLVGGALTEYLSWRYVFWINLPVAAAGLFLTFMSVGKSEKKRASFDFVGFFGLMLGTGGIITALMQGKFWGWGSWPILSMGLGGIFFITSLVVFDRKVPDPFIDFTLFRKRSFAVSTLCIFCIQFIIMLTVFWAIYFQTVLGYSPFFAGIWSMIASSPAILLGSLSGHLFDRFGAKLPIVLGFFLVGFAIAWFICVPVPHSAWQLLPIVLPFGCGIPLIIIPNFTNYISDIAPHKRGVAVGISATIRQMGSTLGLAMFGSLLLHQQERSFQKHMAASSDTASLDPGVFEGLLSHTEGAVAALRALPDNAAVAVESSLRASTIFASTSVNILGLVIAVLGLSLAFKLLPWGKQAAQSEP